MEYALFALAFITISLTVNSIRKNRIINFLTFCGAEIPNNYFVKVVNPLFLVDLEFYNLSLVHYFNKIIKTESEIQLDNRFRELGELKNPKKQKLCQQAFCKALSLTNSKKLAKFYVKLLRMSVAADYRLEILPCILQVVKDLDNDAKDLFMAFLNEERVVLSLFATGQNNIAIEALINAITEIEKSKT